MANDIETLRAAAQVSKAWPYEEARKLRIDGRSRMNKSELQQAVDRRKRP